MEIGISEENKKKIEEVSKTFGLKKKDVVNRALSLYLDSLNQFLDLKNELKIWDSLSDEALSNFEKRI